MGFNQRPLRQHGPARNRWTLRLLVGFTSFICPLSRPGTLTQYFAPGLQDGPAAVLPRLPDSEPV